mmetsp:Transcript_13147/g.19336  ORF Transcript_13147/g.19336 Transcript_13147/m.19336 type:complete len:229 (+) Transcript_13147:701-1387(+)
MRFNRLRCFCSNSLESERKKVSTGTPSPRAALSNSGSTRPSGSRKADMTAFDKALEPRLVTYSWYCSCLNVLSLLLLSGVAASLASLRPKVLKGAIWMDAPFERKTRTVLLKCIMVLSGTPTSRASSMICGLISAGFPNIFPAWPRNCRFEKSVRTMGTSSPVKLACDEAMINDRVRMNAESFMVYCSILFAVIYRFKRAFYRFKLAVLLIVIYFTGFTGTLSLSCGF